MKVALFVSRKQISEKIIALLKKYMFSLLKRVKKFVIILSGKI